MNIETEMCYNSNMTDEDRCVCCRQYVGVRFLSEDKFCDDCLLMDLTDSSEPDIDFNDDDEDLDFVDTSC